MPFSLCFANVTEINVNQHAVEITVAVCRYPMPVYGRRFDHLSTMMLSTEGRYLTRPIKGIVKADKVRLRSTVHYSRITC